MMIDLCGRVTILGPLPISYLRSMDSNRRLVAIVFADVVGYTAMMQEDEQHAMSVINRFNEVLTAQVPAFGGEIIKGYGDGTILFFNSAREAVDLSIELQKAYRKEPLVPLRIGVHLGEVLTREGDYFGNDINVSSRIESMGVAGGVLFSKSIYDRVRNQPHLDAVSLGSFRFKNVADPMEVFALANDQLVVPDKRKVTGKFAEKTFLQKYGAGLASMGALLIALVAFLLWPNTEETVKENPVLGKRVVVMPFENLTESGELAILTKMSDDWITQILLANDAAKVVSASQAELKRAQQSGDYSEMVDRLGTDLIVTGSFYPDGDQIFMTPQVVDARTRDVIYAIQPLQAPRENPVSLLDDLQQELLGSWFLGNDNWVESNPPRYDAYRDFLALREVWGKDDAQAEQLIRNALLRDSSFYRPLISLAQLYFNSYRYAKADSMIQVLQGSNFPLTAFEEMRLQSLQAQINGDWTTAAQVSEAMYERYQQFEQGLDAVVFNLRINQPSQSLSLITSSKELKDLGDCYQCQSAFSSQIDAMLRLQQFQEAADLVSSLRDQVIDADIAINHLRALTKLYQMDEAKSQLEYYKTRPLEWFGQYNPNILYWAVAQELYLTDKKQSLKQFVEEMLGYVLNHPDHGTYEQDLYFAYYLTGQFQEAIVNAEKSVEKFGPFYEADLVALKVYGGDQAAGEEFVGRSIPARSGLGLWHYSQAKVLTALGRKDEAITVLKKAFSEGQSFLWYTFENDVFFKDLLAEPTFQEFVRPT